MKMTKDFILNKIKKSQEEISKINMKINSWRKELSNLEAKEKEDLGEVIVTLAQKPFLSIEGESRRQGEVVCFIRFLGCNLYCHSDIYLECHCDSLYSLKEGPETVRYKIKDLVKEIDSYDCKRLSITGGEPLIHEELYSFLDYIYDYDSDFDRNYCKYDITIETNGSIDISRIKNKYPDIHIIGDWKCKVAFGSKANESMLKKNLLLYKVNDALKFVVTKDDFDEVIEVLEGSQVYKRTPIYISPAWGCVDLKDVVDFIIENRKYGLILSIQQHKLFNLKARELMEVGKTSAEDIWL